MVRKTSVLHTLWSGGIGGAEEYVNSLTRYFDVSKYKIAVCVLSEKGEVYEEIKKNRNVSLFYAGIKNGSDIIGMLKYLQYLQKEQFDIIHLHTRNLLTMFIASFFARKTAIVISHHTGVQNTSVEDIKMQKKIKLFYKLFSKYFKTILAISNTVKESLIHDVGIKYPDKVEIIYNGVDLNKFRTSGNVPTDLQYLINDERRVVGFIGRLVPFKRPELFIKIASELLARDKKYYFVMVGDGPEVDNCKTIIDKHELGDHVKLLGFRRDIPDILQVFDALLFTSEGEGFGIVLIEAMAMGLPVFSINDGAVSEIIRHRQNGILLDTTDPQIIARQIKGVFENNELIVKIRKQSVRDIKTEFSVEKSVKQIESVYERVLNIS